MQQPIFLSISQVRGNASEKTVAKDASSSVRFEFGPDELSFVLSMPSLLKRAGPLRLRARSSFQVYSA